MMNKQILKQGKNSRLIKLEEMLKFQPQSIMGWATLKQRTCSWIYFSEFTKLGKDVEHLINERAEKIVVDYLNKLVRKIQFDSKY